MYEVKFKDENKYSGAYGPVMFNEGVAKVEDQWIAAWFEGKGFEVSKFEPGYVITDLNSMTVEQLKSIAEARGIDGFDKLKKDELIQAISNIKQEGAE